MEQFHRIILMNYFLFQVIKSINYFKIDKLMNLMMKGEIPINVKIIDFESMVIMAQIDK